MLSAQPHIDDLLATEQLRPLRRVEYDRMVAEGYFDEDEKIELLEGVFVQVTPQGVPHAAAIEALEYWVVDVAACTIEIRTAPGEGGYGELRVARAGEAIRLQAFPDVEIAVSDVLR